jgi:hypothetical protein
MRSATGLLIYDLRANRKPGCLGVAIRPAGEGARLEEGGRKPLLPDSQDDARNEASCAMRRRECLWALGCSVAEAQEHLTWLPLVGMLPFPSCNHRLVWIDVSASPKRLTAEATMTATMADAAGESQRDDAARSAENSLSRWLERSSISAGAA